MEQPPAAAWAPGLTWGRGASGPKGDAWDAVEIPGAGLGLQALRSVEVGEVLLSVPLTSCWPVAAKARERLIAAGVEVEEDELSEEALVGLWLCEELREGTASTFAGQLAALPSELDTILQWTEEEVLELQGSCFYPVAVGLREETDAEWEMISTSAPWRAWLQERPELDSDRFRWAKAAVLSRQLELEAEGLPEGAKAVVPGFDLLNHDASGQPNCEFQVETEGEHGPHPSMVVRCARAVAAGEELRTSYGPLPNASLLISHGFVVQDNPFDCVELVMTFAVPPDRRPWLRGLEAAAEDLVAGCVAAFEVVVDGADDADAAFEFSMRHNLTRAAPLPPTLLGAVRLQVLSAGELPTPSTPSGPEGLCAPPGALQASREGLATERLGQILRALLAGHPAPASADVELLRPAASGPALPARRRMAATVRLAEKEILAAALAALGA